MKKNRKVFDNEFRNSAIRYVQEHKELTHAQAAANLGVGKSTLARLKRELRDTKDALEILHQGRTASKKLSAYWAIN